MSFNLFRHVIYHHRSVTHLNSCSVSEAPCGVRQEVEDMMGETAAYVDG